VLGGLLAGAWFLSWVSWVVACPDCSDGGELQRRAYIMLAPAGAGLILGLWLVAMATGAGATWLILSLRRPPAAVA
jgi:hypothetical protein